MPGGADWRLLRYDPFAGDKDLLGVRAQRRKVVTTRTEQKCVYGREPHPMPVGTRAVRYEGIVDRHWRSFYLCAECIERETAEFESAAGPPMEKPE